MVKTYFKTIVVVSFQKKRKFKKKDKHLFEIYDFWLFVSYYQLLKFLVKIDYILCSRIIQEKKLFWCQFMHHKKHQNTKSYISIDS